MSDLEGLANVLLEKKWNIGNVKARLIDEILTFKKISDENAEKLADAVLKEVERSRLHKTGMTAKILSYPYAHVSMGEMGVGSRGEGDLYVHKLIAKMASLGSTTPFLGPLSLDDAGVVNRNGLTVAVAVDGTHSRLSNFPFIAGFHVTRASLRDVYVKGALPIALFDDLHLADDGDIGKLFDFVAGINTVSSLLGVPIVSGSTLRVGGDMVVGDRMVSCVGAVGIAASTRNITARRNIKPGDVMLMTEGTGGGTIATAAIYSGYFEAVLETLNIHFLKVCDYILSSGIVTNIHAMTDVTNGGIRGDANTICSEAGVGMVIDQGAVEGMVNSKVLQMLTACDVDVLGVSLDSLLIFASQKKSEWIVEGVRKKGFRIEQVGQITERPHKAKIISDGKIIDLKPKFRESAYTEIKKVVGEKAPAEKLKLEKRLNHAFHKAVGKRNLFLKFVAEKSN